MGIWWWLFPERNLKTAVEWGLRLRLGDKQQVSCVESSGFQAS